MSEEAHIEALRSLLNTALAPHQAFTVQALEEMPARPAVYVELGAMRRFGGTERLAGKPVPELWRAYTRVVAQQEVNARRLRGLVQDALEDARLSVAGKASTPVRFESADPVAPDEGWFSGLTTWTYASGG